MKKINNLLLLLFLSLPFITFFCFTIVNSHSAGLSAEEILSSLDLIMVSYSFPFIAEPMQSLIEKVGTFDFIQPLCSYVSYCVVVVIGWLIYQLTVFIPLMAQKWIGGFYDKSK